MEKRWCCFIPDQSDLKQLCPNPPEWQIWYGASPDDFTECCSEHLLEMLDDDHDWFNLYRIRQEELAHG